VVVVQVAHLAVVVVQVVGQLAIPLSIPEQLRVLQLEQVELEAQVPEKAQTDKQHLLAQYLVQ
jgi:hypothetical protein